MKNATLFWTILAHSYYSLFKCPIPGVIFVFSTDSQQQISVQ